MFTIVEAEDGLIYYQGKFYRIFFCVFIFMLVNLCKLFGSFIFTNVKADFGQYSFEQWMLERPNWWGIPTKIPKDSKIHMEIRKADPHKGLHFISNDFDL